jgi:hypothetical protein
MRSVFGTWPIAVLAAALPCVAQPRRASGRRVLETTNLTLQFEPSRDSGLSFSIWRWPYPGADVDRLGSESRALFVWLGPWGTTPDKSEMSGECFVGADGTKAALGFFDDIRGTPLGVFAVAARGYKTAWSTSCAPSKRVSAIVQTAAGLKLGLTEPQLISLFGEATSRSAEQLVWRWPWPNMERDYNGDAFRVKEGRLTVGLEQGKVVYFEVSGADDVEPE